MFKLGNKSKKSLEGVHENLVWVVERGIELTKVDFMVYEGLRTMKRQRQLVASGASKTLNSRHLTGEAVDLVPFVGRKPRWDWPLCYIIADAMRSAAIEYGVSITWGGAWDIELNSWQGETEDLVADYVIRRKKAGKTAFIDGPHYQLTLGMT